MLFSQRKGLKEYKKIVQIDDIDNELRNKLWNSFKLVLWNNIEFSIHDWGKVNSSNLKDYFLRLWHFYFKEILDNLPEYADDVILIIKQYFFNCNWYEIYDFIEFTIDNIPREFIKSFRELINLNLESENSAYRLVEDKIVDITSKEEITEIEKAITISEPYFGVKQHLKTALNLLSDKKTPDFRNSIKESISAVEALSIHLTGNKKATLGEALSLLEKKNKIHPALKKAFSSLYGYTSDEGGIRHALLEETTLTKADARFMLVSCSSFINYIISKYSV